MGLGEGTSGRLCAPVRGRINSPSDSAREANMPKINRPVAVVPDFRRFLA